MRDRLSEEDRAARSAAICMQLISLLEQRIGSFQRDNPDKPCDILSYVPYGSEVDVLPVFEYCWSRGIGVAVPRTLPQERGMIFHRISSLDDTEPARPYGIREPRADLPEADDSERIAMVIVPGAAFDAQGNRLGYGGGYFDRFLKRLVSTCGKPPLLAAPCFETQIVDLLPVEPHDRKVDVIVTELRVIRSKDE